MAAFDPVAETYDDVSRWLDLKVYDFCERYGRGLAYRTFGSPEDMRQQAALVFMDVYAAFRPGGGAFVSWLARRLWCRLLDGMKKEIRRRRLLRPAELDLLLVPARPAPAFDLQDFMAGLSADGRKAVQFALSIRHGSKDAKGIVRIRLNQLGWRKSRVRAAFAEVRQALED